MNQAFHRAAESYRQPISGAPDAYLTSNGTAEEQPMSDNLALPEGTYATWDGKQWHPGPIGVWDGSRFIALGWGNQTHCDIPRGPVLPPFHHQWYSPPAMTDEIDKLATRLRRLEALEQQRQQRQRDAEDEGSGHYASLRKRRDR